MKINESIYSSRKTARIVGVLFIIATAAGILSAVFLGPVLADPDYLISFSSNELQVILGALLDLVGVIAFVGLAIVIFPVLKIHNESIAIGYIVTRSFEAVPFIIANIILLSLLTLSREFVSSVVNNAAFFVPIGTGLLTVYEWTQMFGSRIFASLAAVPFYYLLYQSILLPRWISIWGRIGAPLDLASGLLPMFGFIDPSSQILVVMFLPAGLLEMVMSIWLIAKGFNPIAITSEAAI